VSDWTTEATDVIERTVATVRDRTVEPARAITRVVVYGLLAALIALPAVVMLTVGAFRALVLLEQGYAWAAWLTLGGIFLLAGAFSWTRRNP
jgi:predicted metal-binding membrane protein